ncbi:2-hydroxyacid dehydrogenase [Paenibacillus cremeus]|uniref:D-glycerate dehydrogenase n=1 Tax=Paenibacillus cremeus TaxID=2163881 RepID=A0A559K9N0_9BACL|nr:D-glycerate dehydrogenase [Paenibacillus cremeus]TVY08826.1 D-glycerate dehydrogenase [Paenibacillus cremeus]
MKVLITRKIPQSIVKLFEDSQLEIHMWEHEDEPMPHELLLKESRQADAIFTNVSDRIDRELIQHAERLKVISTMAVGFNNIDIAEATRRGIPVGHTPDVLTEAVADLTFSLLLSSARRVVEGMNYIKAGQWKSWGPMLLTGQKVQGATLGIIGMGRIGEGVARRALGFDMNLLYFNRNRKVHAEQRLGAKYKDLDSLLKQSDFIVMLAPSTPETYKMIGAREFSLMKSNAVFINTSRGANVDEQALYSALKDGKIWAAGLDVFEKEPISPDHPLLQLDNVIALPHIGSANVETRMKMAEIAAVHILDGLLGKRLTHCVNPEVNV